MAASLDEAFVIASVSRGRGLIAPEYTPVLPALARASGTLECGGFQHGSGPMGEEIFKINGSELVEVMIQKFRILLSCLVINFALTVDKFF